MVRLVANQEVSVFIASPNDVKPERDIARKIISEINDGFLRGKNYFVRVTRWEEDSYPAYGYDPQKIITKQIVEDFDAVLVMFWKRIGTKTPRDISGTVEELKGAEKQHKKTGRPHIMIYFKQAPVHPHTTDLRQLEAVRNLRQAVSKKAYFCDFEDEANFSDLFRSHFTRWLEKEVVPRASARWSPVSTKSSRPSKAKPTPTSKSPRSKKTRTTKKKRPTGKPRP